MSKQKYNPATISKIIRVLSEYPDGVWLSRLAKEARLPVSTTAYYLDNRLSNIVDDRAIGDGKNPIVRMIKLKPLVMSQIEHGRPINELLRYLKLIEKIRRE